MNINKFLLIPVFIFFLIYTSKKSHRKYNFHSSLDTNSSRQEGLEPIAGKIKLGIPSEYKDTFHNYNIPIMQRNLSNQDLNNSFSRFNQQ